jgi:hypothetical protein
MKVSDNLRKKAVEIAEKHSLKEIWVNDKGEFFTTENNAANSVSNVKEKWAKIALETVVKAAADENSDKK